MKKVNKIILINLILILLLAPLASDLLFLLGLPNQYQIIEGNEQELEVNLPFMVSVSSQQEGSLTVNGREITTQGLDVNLTKPLALQASSVGRYNLKFKLFGIIPLQRMIVNVMPEVKVIPGGQAIGVNLRSDGIMVVKDSFVEQEDGTKVYPAQKAGIQVGDSLLEMNGVEIKSKHHLARLIHQSGQQDEKLEFKIKRRDQSIVTKEARPVKDKSGYYMLGIYVDDGASGVGTMSFYEAEGGYYGALGHMITEDSSKLKIDVGEGEIVRANISGINQSSQGIPGEKLGTFLGKQDILGDIMLNNEFGIYGRLSIQPEHPHFEKPIPIASAFEIEEGPAKMYTVIEGGEIEEFEVEIEKVMRQYQPSEKGLVIRIVDQELLKESGGIVQGMSGSPIVQDGKLAGAVTHVFLNDSTRGYGILAQWMVMQTQNLRNKNTEEFAS
ncbi:SpoIVB peptidase [Natroniella sulfidigena]|uniref:SpoIVB peptidase n=1 Tax=Natroniella sulfidigena TaxID=723921 RepID=UPI00200AC640|nr:SpoIVB peptidase [Natroniella sulfidigena]MCK8817530.1 SpoIVB peptidase [Natroniella sulfidigena]